MLTRVAGAESLRQAQSRKSAATALAPRSPGGLSSPQSLVPIRQARSLFMVHLDSKRGVCLDDGLSRRDFLRVGGLGIGLGLAGWGPLQQLGAAMPAGDKACIQLCLVGGPSQLDTCDLNP